MVSMMAALVVVDVVDPAIKAASLSPGANVISAGHSRLMLVADERQREGRCDKPGKEDGGPHVGNQQID